MIQIDQLLFLSSPHSIRFIVHKNNLFLFHKIGIDNSLHQHCFVLPTIIEHRSISLDHKRLFSVKMFFHGSLLHSLPQSGLHKPPDISDPDTFRFLLCHFLALQKSL